MERLNECKYRTRFGYSYVELLKFSPEEIKEKVGIQYANFSKSKFRKVIKYEAMRYPDTLENYKKMKIIREKCKQILYNAKGRCKYPSARNTRYYIRKGIKCFLILEDILFLWDRDNAHLMKVPSLDRIDSRGDYVLHNCRFIEFAENKRRKEG